MSDYPKNVDIEEQEVNVKGPKVVGAEVVEDTSLANPDVMTKYQEIAIEVTGL